MTTAANTDAGTILVVDDLPQNIRLAEGVLESRGYRVVTAASGQEALERLETDRPDLVLLDVQMPGMDGFEVCRRIRDNPQTFALPVVMITASGDQEKVGGLDAGADDFITKPFVPAELLARIRSLVRLKRYHDTIQHQAAELRAWTEELDGRVNAQLEELERLRRLRRFLSPQVAEMVVNASDDLLGTHRREIAALICDLRGFTAFSETAEPEEIISALADYHGAVGGLANEYEATIGDFNGDGVVLYWNDPIPCPDPANRAVRFAVELQRAMVDVSARWQKLGFDLSAGIGIALGYATLGTIGFEGRFDYGPVGSTMNLAARLSSEALGGQVLINQRAYAAVENEVEATPCDPMTLKGFSRPVVAYRVTSLRST